MLNLDKIVNNKNENDDWPFRMLIIGPSGSGKTNTLLHLINNLHPIDKIYLYAKDLFLIVCFYHVTYEFESESTLYS